MDSTTCTVCTESTFLIMSASLSAAGAGAFLGASAAGAAGGGAGGSAMAPLNYLVLAPDELMSSRGRVCLVQELARRAS
jgi:hypothetical protein